MFRKITSFVSHSSLSVFLSHKSKRGLQIITTSSVLYMKKKPCLALFGFVWQSISLSYRYNMPSSSSWCPCCSFTALNENLFLPESVLPATAEAAQDKQGQAFGTTDDALPDLAVVWEEIQQSSSANDVAQQQQHQQPCIRLVDTHGHAHLEELDNDDIAYASPLYRSLPNNNNFSDSFLSVSCAVAPADWNACVQHASTSPQRMAALGVHPWYLADLAPDWLPNLEALLQQHEGVMVGEIGLCKVAKFLRTYEHGKTAALALQRDVFTKQLDLAAAYQRPVTVHCVHQQQVLLDTLKARSNLAQLPPAIALHSSTGTAHHVDQLLKWEASVVQALSSRRKNKKRGGNNNDGNGVPQDAPQQSPPPPLLYFGFSHTVNYAMCSSNKSRQQGREAIRRVPADRLLAESDVHCTRDCMGGTALAVAYLAWALEEPIAVVAQRTTANALRFLQSIQKATTERRQDAGQGDEA